MKNTTTRSNWFEDFFHGVANDLWRKCMSPEQTRAEADFLEQTFEPRSRLLDVPCGNGRHCFELARRGCRMTGLDISTEFRKWWHWVYTAAEIQRLLEQAGLKPRGCYGPHDGQPFKLGDPLLLLVAEKRAPDKSRRANSKTRNRPS